MSATRTRIRSVTSEQKRWGTEMDGTLALVRDLLMAIEDAGEDIPDGVQFLAEQVASLLAWED